MKIFSQRPSHPPLQEVILYQQSSQLQNEALTEEQQAYLKSREEQKKDFTLLQRLPGRLFLIPVNHLPEGTAGQEKLRRIGNALLSHLEGDRVAVRNHSQTVSEWGLIEGMALGAYRFQRHFTDKEGQKPPLQTIFVEEAQAAQADELNVILEAVYRARDLVNEPLNYMGAEQLAQAMVAAGKQYGFKVDVLNKSKIAALKMGGILAVNKGSQDPPTFTIAEYKPDDARNSRPIVLVGKGVVYDTGGLSLKPTAGSMDSMKSDMAGAAAVIGALSAIAGNQLPVHVIGLIPATDNRPGENAYVPGDIITMYDGSTVEVLNTDAEGRLLLADALAYAKQYDPELVIDLATLTGAAAIAIGRQGLVAMGTAGEEVLLQMQAAGQQVHERLAPFPFWDDYKELLKSSVADVKNIGGREAGAITAGKFLERFTQYPWVHLDIAGPAFLDAADHYRTKGGSGVGVRLLYQYLKNKS